MEGVNILATQGTTVLLLPMILQGMKNSDWPIFRWISDATPKMNRTLAWIIGLLSAVGIHTSGAWHGMAYHATIDFSQFSVDGAMHALFVGGGQLAGQEVVYKVVRTFELLESFLRQQQPPVLSVSGSRPSLTLPDHFTTGV